MSLVIESAAPVGAPAPPHWRAVEQCPVCGSRQLGSWCEAEDEHYGNRGRWHYSACAACGAAFLDPFPRADALARFYPQTYYSFRKFGGAKDKLKRWYRLLMGIPLGARDPAFAAAGTMLDVGCGSGVALTHFRARGWTVRGVEISEQAARVGREAFGLDIVAGTLHDAHFPAEHFDYVRANHSLEHMTDPQEVFNEVFRILKPGGLLHVGVPNRNSLCARWFGPSWFFLGAPVHVFQFTDDALRRLGASAGLAVQRVGYNSDYAGLLGSLQALANRRKPQRDASRGWLYRNPLLVFASQRIANLLDLFKQGDVIEMTFVKPAPGTPAAAPAVGGAGNG